MVPLKPRYAYRGFPGSPSHSDVVVQSSDLQQSLPGSVVAARFHLNHHRFQSHHSFTARFFQVHILQLNPSAADLHGKISAFFVTNPGTVLSVGVPDETQDTVAPRPVVGEASGSDCHKSPRANHELAEDDNLDPAALQCDCVVCRKHDNLTCNIPLKELFRWWLRAACDS